MLLYLCLLAGIAVAQDTTQYLTVKLNKSLSIPSSTASIGLTGNSIANSVDCSVFATTQPLAIRRTVTKTYSGPPTITIYQTTRLTVTLLSTAAAGAAQPEKNSIGLTADDLIRVQDHGSEKSASSSNLHWYNRMNATASMAMSSMTLPDGMSSRTQVPSGVDSISANASSAMASMTVQNVGGYSNRTLTTTTTMMTTVYEDITITPGIPTPIQTLQVHDISELTGRYAISSTVQGTSIVYWAYDAPTSFVTHPTITAKPTIQPNKREEPLHTHICSQTSTEAWTCEIEFSEPHVNVTAPLTYRFCIFQQVEGGMEATMRECGATFGVTLDGPVSVTLDNNGQPNPASVITSKTTTEKETIIVVQTAQPAPPPQTVTMTQAPPPAPPPQTVTMTQEASPIPLPQTMTVTEPTTTTVATMQSPPAPPKPISPSTPPLPSSEPLFSSLLTSSGNPQPPISSSKAAPVVTLKSSTASSSTLVASSSGFVTSIIGTSSSTTTTILPDKSAWAWFKDTAMYTGPVSGGAGTSRHRAVSHREMHDRALRVYLITNLIGWVVLGWIAR